MGRIGYDQMDLNVDFFGVYNNVYWAEFYRDVKDELSPNIP